jgi:hypothetical protein
MMMTRLCKAALISLIVVVTLASLSSYYLQASPNSNPAEASDSASQTPGSVCASATAVSYLPFDSSTNRPVLLLQPGQTAEVCVTYQAAWTNSGTSPENYSFFKSVYFSNGNLEFTSQIANDVSLGNCNCYTSVVSHSFVITASPSSISPAVTTSTVTILYSITPMANATGFYSDFSPAPGLLLAVGHTASAVLASDFPFAGVYKTGGPPVPYIAQNVGLIGGAVTTLTIPRAVGIP